MRWEEVHNYMNCSAEDFVAMILASCMHDGYNFNPNLMRVIKS